jgi:hypothetical protein
MPLPNRRPGNLSVGSNDDKKKSIFSQKLPDTVLETMDEVKRNWAFLMSEEVGVVDLRNG